MHIWYGYDNNLDGVSNDIYPTAFQFKGVDDAGDAVVQGDGRVRDGQLRPRRAALAVQPARVEGASPPRHGMHIEADRRSVQPVQRDQPGVQRRRGLVGGAFFTGTLANHTPNTVFMKPNAYAGDTGQPEQRVGQIGFRFVF